MVLHWDAIRQVREDRFKGTWSCACTKTGVGKSHIKLLTCYSTIQKYACRDKIMFVMTNILSWPQNKSQQKFCCDKHIFVMTNMFVVTKCLLLWEKYICHNKYMFVATTCHGKHNFVTTNTLVLTKDVFCCDKSICFVTKRLSWQTPVCCDKHLFVTTKMIFAAAPASDIPEAGTGNEKQKRSKVEWLVTRQLQWKPDPLSSSGTF